jgi:hypothetical protein
MMTQLVSVEEPLNFEKEKYHKEWMNVLEPNVLGKFVCTHKKSHMHTSILHTHQQLSDGWNKVHMPGKFLHCTLKIGKIPHARQIKKKIFKVFPE